MSTMTTTNPTTYSVALLGFPKQQFTIGQAVRVERKGLSTDPGYEPTYRSGDHGVVETIGEDGWDVGVRFPDGGWCVYMAIHLVRA